MIPFAVIVVFLLWFFCYYIKTSRPFAGTIEWAERKLEKPRFSFVRHPMERKDILPVIIIAVVFSAIAFSQLQTRLPLEFLYGDFVVFTNPLLQLVFPLPVGLGLGAAMVVVLYLFIKNLFGKTPIAVCGTILAGPVFMHLQVSHLTRDNLSALFILLSFYFMYRFITADPEARFCRHSLVPLALSGIIFGVGTAFSWTVLYAGVGLLALFIIRLCLLSRADIDDSLKYRRKSILYFILFFIIVPVKLYWLSYIPYGVAEVSSVRDGLLWNGEFYRLIWNDHLSRFAYSQLWVRVNLAGLWRWLFDIQPVFYRSTRELLLTYINPFVWLGGFMAIIAMVARTAKFRDGAALVILIGYVSQLLPWVMPMPAGFFVLINLSGALFSILALCSVFNVVYERGKSRGRGAVYIYTILSAAVFLTFCILIIVLDSGLWFF